MIASVLVSGIVCLVLWNEVDHRALLGWFAVVLGLAVVRVGLMLGHARDARREQNVAAWERRFVITLSLIGLAWGAGGLWLMPRGSLLHQVVVYFFLMGMAGGAVVSYSAHSVATSVAVVTVMLPATVWFALQDQLILRAMAFGGVIYMAAAYRASKTLAYFLRRSFQLAHELRIAHERAQQLARTDALTGLMNRRAFYEFADAVLKQALRSERRMSAVMLDIDAFKAINDTHGHLAGDEALKAVAGAIRETVRVSDVAGRIGGDEFAMILPDTGVADAAAMAERLRRRVSDIAIRSGAAEVRPTCSIGVAERPGHCESVEGLLAQADNALYRAKHGGRNRVES